jgi:hypothetical protein
VNQWNCVSCPHPLFWMFISAKIKSRVWMYLISRYQTMKILIFRFKLWNWKKLGDGLDTFLFSLPIKVISNYIWSCCIERYRGVTNTGVCLLVPLFHDFILYGCSLQWFSAMFWSMFPA